MLRGSGDEGGVPHEWFRGSRQGKGKFYHGGSGNVWAPDLIVHQFRGILQAWWEFHEGTSWKWKSWVVHWSSFINHRLVWRWSRRLWNFDLGASEGLRRAPGRLKMLKLQQKSAQQEGSWYYGNPWDHLMEILGIILDWCFKVEGFEWFWFNAKERNHEKPLTRNSSFHPLQELGW